ncbi:MAG: protein kinase [Planctomycetota bacterium]
MIASKYRLLRLLGEGGMGAVYEAEQRGVQRHVAVKLLHPHLRHDERQLQRFEREARAVAALGHPNIPLLIDLVDDEDGPPALVMEYQEGLTLKELVTREGPLSQERAATVGAQILSALCAAHEAGIVHRDLKPANVLVCTAAGIQDFVKVLDFGIAKLMGDAVPLTDAGVAIGTLAYMAPEQARGEEVDFSADVYGAGASLYHALTGRAPFSASSTPQLFRQVEEDEPIPLEQLRPDLEPAFRDLVHRAMAKRATDRWSDASAMLDALVPWLPSGRARVLPVARDSSPEGAGRPTPDAGPRLSREREMITESVTNEPSPFMGALASTEEAPPSARVARPATAAPADSPSKSGATSRTSTALIVVGVVVVVVWILGAWLFVASGGDTPASQPELAFMRSVGNLDRAIFLRIYGGTAPGASTIIAAILALAGSLWALPVVMLFAIPQKTRTSALRIAGAVLTTCLAALVIRLAIHRPRPFATIEGVRSLVFAPPSDPSCPSGQAAGVFCAALLIYWMLPRRLTSTQQRGALVGLLALATVVSLARVYLGTNYPFDVLFGATMGVVGAVAARRVFAL